MPPSNAENIVIGKNSSRRLLRRTASPTKQRPAVYGTVTHIGRDGNEVQMQTNGLSPAATHKIGITEDNTPASRQRVDSRFHKRGYVLVLVKTTIDPEYYGTRPFQEPYRLCSTKVCLTLQNPTTCTIS
jgi:hypothetical protein